MVMKTSQEIREQFLEFFKSKGHQIVPSAPIVIKNDPTLMFTNAGMNQFKDYFLGNKKAPYPRIADTQKCLRVSGKHNDLEEVGVDTYHHTMFEMLGNWSFGDYFKEKAIAWSWELLTIVYQIDKDRLYVTVFGGDEKEGLPKDEEAFIEWKKWIPEDRILFGNKIDNFWEMGDTGPCGPCTEINFDYRSDEERKDVDGKTLVNAGHPQVVEIWNNVFIQFNRLKDGTLELLPAKHVDTGMGFERLVRTLQNKQSNYDTDVFSGTIETIEMITKRKYNFSGSKEDIAFRVIADHIRAIGFCIADGQLPSNTGAGYVIRRILRRAVRYYFNHLNYKEPLLFQLVSTISKQFENVFPELNHQRDFVAKVVKEEEESFLRTLDKGLKRIENIINHLSPRNSTKATISGKEAFELFDTYGFPLDLTKLIAVENNMFVDDAGFEAEMQLQKNRSRSASVLETEDWIILIENPVAEFVGYDSLDVKSKVVKYRKVKNKGKEFFQVVLDATPFYAESGGQIGDTGRLIIDDAELMVTDTKKENNLIIHFTESLPSHLSGDVIAKVDAARRKSIAIHHSATHLLHAALRQVLGRHVQQKGSLVNEEHLRFDFSHFTAVNEAELKKIQEVVNEKILENIPVIIKEMHMDEAVKMGAMALFGEKYGDRVRVVIIDPSYSIELCGGTHVGRTGDLGSFIITLETAVAAGVRRIEGKAGRPALHFVQENFVHPVEQTKKLLKKKSVEITDAVKNLISENGDLKKHIEHLEARQLVTIRNELLKKDEIINQINFIGCIIEVSSAEALKKLCFDLNNHLRDFVIVLCSNIGGKPFVVVSIAENVVAAKNMDSAKIIKETIAPIIKGGGGGQPTMATAGGQDPSNLQLVIDKVKALIA
jgi:alanyl-tRNA synthetase